MRQTPSLGKTGRMFIDKIVTRLTYSLNLIDGTHKELDIGVLLVQLRQRWCKRGAEEA